MKRLLLFVVLVAVAARALGYWRGWYSLTKEGTVKETVPRMDLRLQSVVCRGVYGCIL